MKKEGISLAALLLGAVLAFGQQPAPPAADKTDQGKEQPSKSKLEEMLEKALKDNPDVRLAAAKLSEAEAELTRARLLVVQKVAAAYQAVESQKAAVESATAEFEEVKTMHEAGKAGAAELSSARAKLIDAKAKLAQLEADLPYLLGQQPASVDEKILRGWMDSKLQPPDAVSAEMLRRWYLDLYGRLPTKEEMAAGAAPVVQGPTADRIRAALDKPFSYECKDKPINEVLRDLSKAFQEANQGLLIKDKWRNDGPSGSDSVPALTVHFDHMPFGAALEWVEDSAPPYAPEEGGAFRFVVRDYGLVLVVRDQAPPGAPLLHDFWKGAKTGDKAAPTGAPAKLSEGQVKEVDKDGRIRVSIGRNDGVAKGDVLIVYRQEDPNGRAMLVGDVRVIEVADGESTAQAEGTPKQAIQPGDKVNRK